jgi:hypothetical protein
MVAKLAPMATQSSPESSTSNRIIIIAVVVLVLALVGYCATRVASLSHTVIAAARRMQSRRDTTHHVAPGSAVYLGDAKVADIVRVVVIHADTSTPKQPAGGTVDSTVAAILRSEHAVYSASSPAPAVAAQLNDPRLIGQITGTYDDTVPVRITLGQAPAGTNPMSLMTTVQLHVPGRTQDIALRAPSN